MQLIILKDKNEKKIHKTSSLTPVFHKTLCLLANATDLPEVITLNENELLFS